jgi:hypothetical protein
MLAANTWGLYRRFSPLAKRGDYARVAAYLEQAEQRNQPIFIFPPDEAFAFAHHYSGRNRVVPLPHAASLTRWDARALALSSEEQVRNAMASATASSSACWLITAGVDVVQDVPLRPDRLEAVLRSSYLVEERKEFHLGTTLRLLHRPVR